MKQVGKNFDNVFSKKPKCQQTNHPYSYQCVDHRLLTNLPIPPCLFPMLYG